MSLLSLTERAFLGLLWGGVGLAVVVLASGLAVVLVAKALRCDARAASTALATVLGALVGRRLRGRR